MGPSGNGLVERMKAGETPWNQGCSNGRPCPFPEGCPEDLEKLRGEEQSGARFGETNPRSLRSIKTRCPSAAVLRVATNRALHMGLSRPSYCAYYLGRRLCIVDRQAPLWSKMLSISKAYRQFRRWHVACDAEPAQTPAGAQARASHERDIATIHSTHAVAGRPMARRLLLA